MNDKNTYKLMKYFILFFFLGGLMGAQAQQKQSLKDLLYSGKLKKDSSGIIRNTDDLSTKIDTTRKEAIPEKRKIATVTSDSIKNVSALKVDSAIVAVEAQDSVATTGIAPNENRVPVRTNNKIWKDYIDSLVKSLKSEVLTSKQIKKETYYVTIDYEIEIDGKMSVVNVISSPENSFLQSQVGIMLDSSPLQLNPVLDSANKPRKVKRKQNFSITKD
jgi:hypothetical protein